MRKLHIEAAVPTACSNHSLLSDLPHDHRSFDLWTYHFLTQRCSTIHDGEIEQRPQESMPYCHEVDMTEAQTIIMSQRPGPFEIDDDGRMANPCLRSCLLWTVHEVANTRIDPVLLGSLDGMRLTRFYRAAMCSALFCTLWERWQSGEAPSRHQLIWTTKAEKLMDISASQLLYTMIDVFLCDRPPEPSIDPVSGQNVLEWHFVDRILKILQESGRTLAERFLKSFSCCECWSVSQSDEWWWYLCVTREYAERKLEQGLKMTLPEVIFNVSHAEATGRYRGQSTSSMHSFVSILTESDLASFRSLRDRIQKGVQKAGHFFKTTRPSSVFQHRFSDAASLFSVNDLSSTFQSMSLDSSGSRFGSTSEESLL